MDKTQKDLDLYFLTRNVQWRYRLDQYEDAVIAEMLKTVRAAVADVQLQLFNGDTVPRGDALLDELQALSAGLRKRLGEDVADMATEALNYSSQEHASILSLDSRVPINNVALSADQFRAFLGGPAGGVSLPAWVDAAWGSTVTEQIKRNLNVAVLQGEGYQKAVRGLLESSIADFTEREAVTIARTYVQTASVAAQMSLYEANDDLVTGWKWSAVLEGGYSKSGRGTCLRCSCLDQRQFKMGEGPPIPLHPRCLTGETPVVAPDKVAAFIAPYRGMVVEIGLPDGTSISVTPNHLFLTRDGFVSAEALNEGDEIFYSAGANGPVGLIGPDDDGKPTPIKEIVEAMAKAPGMVTVRVPHSPEYFHGDGEFVDGYIDVIAPDCFLRGEGNAAVPEHSPEAKLVLSDLAQRALSPERDFTHPLIWLWLATHCDISGKSVSDILLPSAPGHHDSVGLGRATPLNPSLIQSALNDNSVDAEHSAQFVGMKPGVVEFNNLCNGKFYSVLSTSGGCNSVPSENASDCRGTNADILSDFGIRFSGVVTTANIVFKRERQFSGHVYDLQTLSSMYHVAGLLSSNCRCVALPVLKSWRELGLDRDELDAAIRPYTIRPDANIDAGGMRTIIESGRHQGDYASWFEKQGRAFQQNVVGPGRLELLDKGKIKFEELVDGQGRQRTLAELNVL